ncbi:hypothetical protein ID866_9613 [Astraeus odoratus]|nr:hypothetical protein ID866_9613 [Astraeus odoratus]
MDTSNKNINWQEVSDQELGWNEANPEDIAMAKLQEKFQCKWVWEAKEAKKCWEAEEAKKRECKAERWQKTKRQREAKKQREAEKAKEASSSTPSPRPGPVAPRAPSAFSVRRQVLRMGKVVEELWGLRKGVATMAKSNWDLAWVLYHGFQSVDTLVDEVQIFEAEGFLPKLVPESKPAKDELQETLREVEELQEEHLEWAMEHLQMRKE